MLPQEEEKAQKFNIAEFDPSDIESMFFNRSSSVVRCLSFHYWIRSVLEFIHVSDDEVNFTFTEEA